MATEVTSTDRLRTCLCSTPPSSYRENSVVASDQRGVRLDAVIDHTAQGESVGRTVDACKSVSQGLVIVGIRKSRDASRHRIG